MNCYHVFFEVVPPQRTESTDLASEGESSRVSFHMLLVFLVVQANVSAFKALQRGLFVMMDVLYICARILSGKLTSLTVELSVLTVARDVVSG